MEKLKPEYNFDGRQGAIVGVGNVLQQDDGIGVKILKYLEAAYRFPPNVALIDGGTIGAGLQSLIMDKQWLLIIDALAVPGEPGEVRFIPGGQVLSRPADLKLSPHQISFFDLIQLMELSGSGLDEFTILGIIPERTGVGTDISPAVNAGMDRAVSRLLSWLSQKGIAPFPEMGRISPDYWWV